MKRIEYLTIQNTQSVHTANEKAIKIVNSTFKSGPYFKIHTLQ